MGKAGKWLRNFLTGKQEKKKDKEKDKEQEKTNTTHQNSTSIVENPATPIAIRPTTPKDKRRWSFRRSSAAAKDSNSAEPTSTPHSALLATLDNEDEQKKHAMAMEAATAAAADAAVAAAQAAAAVIRLTVAAAAASIGRSSAIEQAAAIKIQSVFRSYLARKALCALRGLVKLQALVRGHLVRKQATATLRCMQALVTVQARARAQRIRMAEEGKPVNQRQSPHRKSTQENRYRHSNYDLDRGMEENIKIVEMDYGETKGNTKGRNSYSHRPQTERKEHRISTHYPPSNRGNSKQDNYQVSSAPSALTDSSPQACSEEFSFSTTQSSPQCHSAVSKPDPSRVPFAFQQPDYPESLSYDYPLYPNYMANTESSRAKFRSQSAPKQRLPDSFERQPSRRRPSMEGRIIPRVVRMQRSSSHVGSASQNYQFPWSIKLDKSTVSIKDSECGSTSTLITNTDIQGDTYQ